MIQAYATQTLAVLEILPTSEEINVTTTEMRHLSDELLSLLPPDSEEAECLAEACAVEIGRAIGAEYVSQGKIGSFSGDLSLSIELCETMSGKLLGSIVMESNDVKGLMGVIREQASALFANLKKVESEELKVESETNNSQFSTLHSQLSTRKKVQHPILHSPHPRHSRRSRSWLWNLPAHPRQQTIRRLQANTRTQTTKRIR